MTVVIPMPNTLSTGAQQALAEMLRAGVKAADLLGRDAGWSADDALAAARELTAAGYGRMEGLSFYLDIKPRTIPTLETDLLDDIAPVLDAVQEAWDATCQLPVEKHPDCAPNRFGITSRGALYGVLMVLVLAAHDLRGEINALPATVQFPLVAQNLARHLMHAAEHA